MSHDFHKPVLVKEICSHVPQDARSILDGTTGDGGHAEALCTHCLSLAHYLALDRDPKALERAKGRLAKFPHVHFFNRSYEFADECAASIGVQSVDAILLDLGFSSPQIENPERGFSFQADGPLDMRYDQQSVLTAEGLLATLSADELATIFRRYGEERFAFPIAEAIVRARELKPITRTKELADIIVAVYAQRLKSHSKLPWVGGKHPATKVFQALRIAVNDELGTIRRALPRLASLLVPNGLLLVITFHSLEDATVKEWVRQESRDCICPPRQAICTCSHKASITRVTTKPIVASPEEQKENPRSRSAHLRIIKKN